MQLSKMHFKVVAERVRPDGTRSRVAEAVVGDETGCITLNVSNGEACDDTLGT